MKDDAVPFFIAFVVLVSAMLILLGGCSTVSTIVHEYQHGDN